VMIYMGCKTCFKTWSFFIYLGLLMVKLDLLDQVFL
jgi:hypothetical protein